MAIKIKRIYDAPEKSDGVRILIDRLWPRGLSKDKVKLDLWLKDVAPSSELRTWFGHDPEKWQEFRRKYIEELRDRGDAVNSLLKAAKAASVTLLFAAKDEEHNNAVVLRDFIANSQKTK